MAFPWAAVGSLAGDLLKGQQASKVTASTNAANVAIAQAQANAQIAAAQMSSNNITKLIPLGLGFVAVLVVLMLVLKKK